MATRLERVCERMRKMELEQMIVSDYKSIWYLTGVGFDPYERLFALLVRTDGRHVLFLNRLFNVSGSGFEEVWYSDTDDYIGLLASRLTPGRLGIDKSWAARFLIPLQERRPDIQAVLGSDCVDQCRAIKDAEEIAIMKQASHINDTVMLRAKNHLIDGMSERQLAAFINAEYLREGAEGPCFTTIVSFAANAADPHHEPDDTIVRAGYAEAFTHRLGHFIGQDDHEQNDVSSTSAVIAESGMIFSIEPGIYLPGHTGVRIEDLVLVTDTGVEILNHMDKHPLLITPSAPSH